MIACRKQFTDTLLELAREDKDIIAVTTDARGSVTLGDYASALPGQFVECGIAEQVAFRYNSAHESNKPKENRVGGCNSRHLRRYEGSCHGSVQFRQGLEGRR